MSSPGRYDGQQHLVVQHLVDQLAHQIVGGEGVEDRQLKLTLSHQAGTRKLYPGVLDSSLQCSAVDSV